MQWRSISGNEFNFIAKASNILSLIPGKISHFSVNACKERIEGNVTDFFNSL